MDPDVLKFQLWRTLNGTVEHADLYRHNGKVAASFRSSTEPSACEHADPYTRYRHLLAANLTDLEEHTWYRLLSGYSIAAIALEDGTSRAAIYIRIRGKNGQGGMARKNRWVARWWRRRQNTHS